MRYAIHATAPTYEGVLRWARFAESKGLDAFAVPDHYVLGPDDAPGAALDALAVLAGLARDTTSIPLVLLVGPVTWRHPAVLAKTAATLADMAGDRVTVGLGAGWLEQEHTLLGIPFPDRPIRFAMLEEALGYLRAVFSEPPVDFAGEHFSFTAFDVLPRPPLRLLVGGNGTMWTPRLAGTYADEFNAYPAPFEVWEAKLERARRAAVAVGRPEPAVSTSAVVLGAATQAGVHERLEQAAAAAGHTPGDLEDRLRMRNAPYGTWDQVRATIAGYEERGARRVYLQAFVDDITQMEENLAQLVG